MSNVNRSAQPVKHDDDEVITRNSFPYSELYGPNWGPDFNPLYRNIITGDVLLRAHHARGGGARTRASFDLSSGKCLYAFCLNFETVVRSDRERERVRCGECFLINSQGCGKDGHQTIVLKDDGPNSIFKKLIEGKEVTWKVLKDPSPEVAAEVVDPKQVARDAAAALEARLEDELERLGVVDHDFMKDVYAQRSQADRIAKKTAKEAGRGKTRGGKTVAIARNADVPQTVADKRRDALDAKAANGGKAMKTAKDKGNGRGVFGKRKDGQ
ncbi:hypothetical protein J1614_009500 [Plenodomus biglobosus]|nr:hypothetical protein J1614_009500 [Plenodomus biglobosus]